MEAIAAVSSVVGILGFAGQAITGITTLHNFYQDCRTASKTVDRFLRELEALRDTINQVESLIAPLGNNGGVDLKGPLSSLQIQLEDCKRDVERWIVEAQKTRWSFGMARGVKRAFKKFLVVVNQKSVKDIFLEIKTHKDNISLKLAIIGRYQELDSSAQSQELKEKLCDMASSTEISNRLTIEAVNRLEGLVSTLSLQQQISFGSLESRASMIQSLFSVRSESQAPMTGQKRKAESLPGELPRPPPNTVVSSGNLFRHRDLISRPSSRPSSMYRLHSAHGSTSSIASRMSIEFNPSALLDISSEDYYQKPQLATETSYMCECCPKKPKKFSTAEELTAHENEKRYECSYCRSRFKDKDEAETHQNSLHLRRHSWSCAALSGYAAVFYESTEHIADTCGFCGGEFSRSGQHTIEHWRRYADNADWEKRILHLREVHKFGECNHAKKFFRSDHFRQHLKHSHASCNGVWIDILVKACMKDEPLPDPLPNRRTKPDVYKNGFASNLANEHQPLEIQETIELCSKLLGVMSVDYAAESSDLAKYIEIARMIEKLTYQAETTFLLEEHVPIVLGKEVKYQTEQALLRLNTEKQRLKILIWASGRNIEEIDEKLGRRMGRTRSDTPEIDHELFMITEEQISREAQAWRTQTDRINAWLLQSLLASEQYAQLHRSFLPDGLDLSQEQWARQTLKYWPLDEAAVWVGDRGCSTNGAVNSDRAQGL